MWDPQQVLNYISKWFPNSKLSIEHITKKLVMLLALCTAHRVQTFALIKVENINITESGVVIRICNIIKTSAPGRDQPILVLPYFKENINICPATTIKDYLAVTRDIRSYSS